MKTVLLLGLALIFISCAHEEREEPFRIHYTEGPIEFAGVPFGLHMRDAEIAIEQRFGGTPSFHSDIEFSPVKSEFYYVHKDTLCGHEALIRWGLGLHSSTTALISVQVELYTDSTSAEQCLRSLVNLDEAGYTSKSSMQEYHWCTRELYHTYLNLMQTDTMTLFFIGWDRQFASYQAARRFVPTWTKNF
jgi:hypothetical protein